MALHQLDLVLFLTAFVFVVQAVPDYHDPHCGGRQVIVHLFEWKWTDIAAECERYLGPKEFCAVQVSPPQEQTIVTTDAMRPWWERYQPISYKVISRSGDEAQFKDMVDRCRKVGVRIIVDSVINHMAGLGRKGTGIGGTHFDSDARDFPGVPYSKPNFNDRSKCPSHDGGVNNYGDPRNVRNCNLSGLTDLDGGQDYVRDKVAGYFNHLIALRVAGFRIDAAKHMWPGDIAAIQARTHDLPEGGRPFFVHEVIDRNDGAIKVNEYFNLGYVTEFRYLQKVKEGANDLGRLKRCDGEAYKRAVAFTLANDYGFTRVMSSYYFTDGIAGPPHESDYSTKDVTINADGSCGNGWVCEHRWPMIGNMAKFRNAVVGTHVENFRYQNGVMSFNRGDKGFFAMSDHNFDTTVYTGLPAGEYCDLISECAMKVTVNGNGNANIRPHDLTVPYVAFVTEDGNNFNLPTVPAHMGTPTSNNQENSPNPTHSPDQSSTEVFGPTSSPDFQRTLIIFEKPTMPGQDLFIRGGIDHGHRQGCTSVAATSPCSIPIRHNNQGVSGHYGKVNAWSKGDNYLDWGGAEPGQGTYQGQPAEGTPAYWYTNDITNSGYSELNKYGDHYWIVDVEMDCSKTENGFFEVKAVVNGNWEGNMPANLKCTGSGAATPPYMSQNHFARCGYRNVLHFNQVSCEIDDIS